MRDQVSNERGALVDDDACSVAKTSTHVDAPAASISVPIINEEYVNS